MVLLQVMMQTMPYPLNDPLLFDDLFQAVQHKNFSVTFPNHDGARLSVRQHCLIRYELDGDEVLSRGNVQNIFTMQTGQGA